MPLSKNKQKYIKSLETKKARSKEGVFVVEGTKSVNDMLRAGFYPKLIVAEQDWINASENLIKQAFERSVSDCKGFPNTITNNTKSPVCEIITVDAEELRRTSFLQHPQQVLAVFYIPDGNSEVTAELFTSDLVLMLDGVQDPGNLGTIIRIADWFGINTIICSNNTVDAYAPKVVQATMGSIARVKVIYTDLCELLSSLPKDIPVYGTLLDGENLYGKELHNNGIIIMGNEGNGISQEVRHFINNRILIPSYPANSPTAESLNVSIATAITVAEFRRNAM